MLVLRYSITIYGVPVDGKRNSTVHPFITSLLCQHSLFHNKIKSTIYLSPLLYWSNDSLWSCQYNSMTSSHDGMLFLSIQLKCSPVADFHGPVTRYVILRVAYMPGTFSLPALLFSNPDMHHGMWVMHMPWCMPGSLTGGFFWSRRRGKRSRHSQCMRNPQFYVSGKRLMQAPYTNTLLGGIEQGQNCTQSQIMQFCLASIFN